MDIRNIHAGAQGLPGHMATVEASSYEEGVRAMIEAWCKPGINLVVWTNAGDLIDPDAKARVDAYVKASPVFTQPSPGRRVWRLFNSAAGIDRKFDEYIADHFNEAVAWSGYGENAAGAFRTLRDSWKDFCHALDDASGLKFLKLGMRVSEKEEAYFHGDCSKRHGMRFVRTPAGAETLFAEDGDIEIRPWLYSVNARLKKDAERLWSPEPWAVSMLGGPIEKTAVHTHPSEDLGVPAADMKRMAETADVICRKPFFG